MGIEVVRAHSALSETEADYVRSALHGAVRYFREVQGVRVEGLSRSEGGEGTATVRLILETESGSVAIERSGAAPMAAFMRCVDDIERALFERLRAMPAADSARAA